MAYDVQWRHDIAKGFITMVNDMRRSEIMSWRKSERTRLIAARLAVDAVQRAAWSACIEEKLDSIIGDVRDVIISFYWPIRGEPDLRRLMGRVDARGGISALPVVIEKGQALVFRRWREGEPLQRGVWNIPVPAEGKEVVPDIAVAPVVGFDGGCFRLGYGGGFFDRTLSALGPQLRVFGVGFALQAIPTIYPLSHDIPMSVIVTEEEVRSRSKPIA